MHISTRKIISISISSFIFEIWKLKIHDSDYISGQLKLIWDIVQYYSRSPAINVYIHFTDVIKWITKCQLECFQLLLISLKICRSWNGCQNVHWCVIQKLWKRKKRGHQVHVSVQQTFPRFVFQNIPCHEKWINHSHTCTGDTRVDHFA